MICNKIFVYRFVDAQKIASLLAFPKGKANKFCAFGALINPTSPCQISIYLLNDIDFKKATDVIFHTDY